MRLASLLAVLVIALSASFPSEKRSTLPSKEGYLWGSQMAQFGCSSPHLQGTEMVKYNLKGCVSLPKRYIFPSGKASLRLVTNLFVARVLIWERNRSLCLVSYRNHAWNSVTLTTRALGVIRGFEAVVKRSVRKHIRRTQVRLNSASKTQRDRQGKGYGKHTVNSRSNRRHH